MTLALVAAAFVVSPQGTPLTYELRKLDLIEGQACQVAKSGNISAKGFKAKQFFDFQFAGASRPAALGEQEGRQALILDTCGCGKLDDHAPIYLTTEDYQERFGPFAMRWKQGENKFMVHYVIDKYQYSTGDPALHLRPVGVFKGDVQIGGRSYEVLVTDAGAKGDLKGSESVQIRAGAMDVPISQGGGIGVDGRFYKFLVSDRADRLSVEPLATETTEASYQGESAYAYFEMGGARFFTEGSASKIVLPKGNIKLRYTRLTRKGKDGKLWDLTVGPVNTQGVEVPAQSILNIEPIKVGVEARKSGGEYTFTLETKTSQGLTVYGLTVEGQNPPEPSLTLSRNGKQIDKPKFHYG